MLIDEVPEMLTGVQQIIVGGEPLSVPHVTRGLQSLPDTLLVNGYGPTESTTVACAYKIPGRPADDAMTIPIGRPIANTQAYILDSKLDPVPVGVTGELFIGGDGLARGYWNRPDLTDEAFIPSPFSKETGPKIYRTGDLARYLPDGNIDFIGRRDHQVKIRGYRVELGEIEAVLLQHGGVKEAAVLAREDQPGDKRLVGYVVGRTKPPPKAEDLWIFLRQKLPVYMIPGTFMFLPELPLNKHGKIDRNSLPAPDQSRPVLEQRYRAPESSCEKAVAEIWRYVMGIDKVGIHDNFFELGGHSLTATRVISRLRNVFDIDIPLSILFDHPTVSGLVEHIEKTLSGRKAKDY
jgi:acyl-coenzyme A synthetase/AMP-(fatty) acid ligase/acyl carrier protein